LSFSSRVSVARAGLMKSTWLAKVRLGKAGVCRGHGLADVTVGVMPSPVGCDSTLCARADLDGDGDVDLADWLKGQPSFGGGS